MTVGYWEDTRQATGVELRPLTLLILFLLLENYLLTYLSNICQIFSVTNIYINLKAREQVELPPTKWRWRPNARNKVTFGGAH